MYESDPRARVRPCSPATMHTPFLHRRSPLYLLLSLLIVGCESEPAPGPAGARAVEAAPSTAPIRGIYTVVYSVPDLVRAREWYAQAFQAEPYFDEPFYVGFNVAGYELGLQPEEGDAMAGPGGSTAYWGVADADETYARLVSLGATPGDAIQDVGGGVRIGSVRDPFGNVVGIVENPQFPAAN